MNKIILLLFLSHLPLYGESPHDGYIPLFNGKDLDGWWGLKTEDPNKWMNLSVKEMKSKWQASQKDIRRHWRVEDGMLVNDGKGLFLSTEKN